MSDLLGELDLLNTVKFEGHNGRIVTELTKKQKELFDAFDIDRRFKSEVQQIN